jgi:hypothetical protein
MITEYQYIHFVRHANPGRKTDLWACHNNKSLDCLGVIRWYGPWRQYCFSPEKYDDLVFSRGCLNDIGAFIKQLMDERKASR